MNIEEFTAYCLNKKGVEESFPFGGDTLVFKAVSYTHLTLPTIRLV